MTTTDFATERVWVGTGAPGVLSTFVVGLTGVPKHFRKPDTVYIRLFAGMQGAPPYRNCLIGSAGKKRQPNLPATRIILPGHGEDDVEGYGASTTPVGEGFCFLFGGVPEQKDKPGDRFGAVSLETSDFGFLFENKGNSPESAAHWDFLRTTGKVQWSSALQARALYAKLLKAVGNTYIAA